MATVRGLGKGLSALITGGIPPDASKVEPPAGSMRVPISRVRPGPWQPRRSTEEDALAELTESVRQHGILQPLLVRKVGDGYELIAGERRLRAATAAGLAEVPVTVVQAADREALEMALTENLQRQDLNILEEAAGYQLLQEQFGLTQEQIAARIGKARATVTNALRLLTLPDGVRAMVRDGRLCQGHAKALLSLSSPEEQILLAQRAVDEALSVRQLERLVEKAQRAPRKPRVTRCDLPGAHLVALTEKLQAHFGTRVRLTPSRTYINGKKGRGLIEIEFYSNEELERILDLLGIPAV